MPLDLTTFAGCSQLRLSAVIMLLDDWTGGLIQGRAAIKLQHIHGYERRRSIIAQADGVFTLVNVPSGLYQISVEAQYYHSRTTYTLYLPGQATSFADMSIILRPNANYPFPADAVLIRGIITNQQGTPLPGVAIAPSPKRPVPLPTVSAFNGRFIMYFKTLNSDSETIQLRLTKRGFNSNKVTLNVQPGRATLHTFKLSPAKPKIKSSVPQGAI
ncbi:MAG: hypothetical protein ETSY2_45540 [Candidatus Entotheonella gemina]|uniref:Uncharacterized protein n=1 Tax=Candidatus Entotheonella gemina TaxID=1429439 RepID=W4LGA9_9BACT|nr:MAG: hypothetical protein ETSY2_45540 [Candidatus Entotheonella gemina]